jgi:hypothetical protein
MNPQTVSHNPAYWPVQERSLPGVTRKRSGIVFVTLGLLYWMLRLRTPIFFSFLVA